MTDTPKPWQEESDKSREQYLRDLLDEVHGDIDAARESASWQAVAALTRRAASVRDDLDDILKDGLLAGDLTNMDEDDFLEGIERIAAGMPDAHLEVFVSEYRTRHRLPPLEVLEGGKTE